MISLRGRVLRLICSISWFIRTRVYPTLGLPLVLFTFTCFLRLPPVLFARVCPYHNGEYHIASRGPIPRHTFPHDIIVPSTTGIPTQRPLPSPIDAES